MPAGTRARAVIEFSRVNRANGIFNRELTIRPRKDKHNPVEYIKKEGQAPGRRRIVNIKKNRVHASIESHRQVQRGRAVKIKEWGRRVSHPNRIQTAAGRYVCAGVAGLRARIPRRLAMRKPLLPVFLNFIQGTEKTSASFAALVWRRRI